MQADYTDYNYSVIGDILAKYPELTQDEENLLQAWRSVGENEQFFQELVNSGNRHTMLERYFEIIENKEAYLAKANALLDEQESVQPVGKIRRFNRGWIYMAAASIVLVVVATWLLISTKQTNNTNNEAKPVAVVSDVTPGKFKAKLRLADGSVVYLDSATNKKISQQGSIAVINKDGQLVYEQKGKQNEVLYNTLTTSRGETYATVLSDGSKVWLNSQSSIRYPVAFTGAIRKVEITGEAYFEVAHAVGELANGQKAKRPFVVGLPGMEVEVLGTHFNINSYEDEEAVKTTLLEGSVRVKSKTDIAVLTPGQQAQLTKTGEITVAKNVDLEKAVAWKNGLFLFNGDNVKSVMNQLSRWYDLKVIYKGNVNEVFYGAIDRSESVARVLEILQKGSAHFKIQDRTIIVTP